MEIEIGKECIFILTKKGQCYVRGELSNYEEVAFTFKTLTPLEAISFEIPDKKFKQIAVGYSHALLLGQSGKVFKLSFYI
jgi:alpha-tubulin suppressor-like RCC1 family protein